MRDLSVQLGSTTTLGDLVLHTQTIELSEIVVPGQVFGIDPSSPALGANVGAADYDALPVGRDYRSIMEFLPQANASYLGDAVNIGGATGSENAYFVDGINLTDAVQGGPGASLVPYNFVRAVEVNEAGYEARYGRSIGGTVNAVTYSGGNTLEGQVFAFFTGQALTGPERVGLRDLPNSRFANYDVGGRVTGPIVADRLWFAAAYNPQVERVDRSVPGQGVFEDRLTRHLFAGKLTWKPRSATTFEAFLLGDRTSHLSVSPPFTPYPFDSATTPDPYLSDISGKHLTGSLSMVHQFHGDVLLELTLSRSRSSSSTVGETDSLFYQDLLTGTVSGGNWSTEQPRLDRTAVSARATWTPGAHTLILGTEYEDNQYQNRFRFADIRRTGNTQWIESLQDASGTVYNRVPTIYLQDSWSLSTRLTLSGGVRWARERLYGTDGLAQSFRDEWQPRVGGVLQLGRLGTQRLTASWGIFYQQQPLNLSMLNYIPYPFFNRYYSSDPRTPGVTSDSVLDWSSYPSQFPNVPGLSLEHHSEWTLGYERLLGNRLRLAVRVVKRDLLSAFGMGFDFTRNPIYVIGTPGKGDFSFVPSARREYTGLEVSSQWRGAGGRQVRLSYVLSRTYGNYPGLYLSDLGVANQGILAWLGMNEQAANSSGLLPNDRTHVLKLSAAYPLPRRVTIGAFGTWQSGVPLSEFGASSVYPTVVLPTYVTPRGSHGRSPSIWDLNLRVQYAAQAAKGLRLILDWLHVGSPRRAVWLEQQHYLAQDANGNQISPKPTYGQALRYQPPTQVRVGMEYTF